MECCVYRGYNAAPRGLLLSGEFAVPDSNDTSNCLDIDPTLAATAGRYKTALSGSACIESKSKRYACPCYEA